MVELPSVNLMMIHRVCGVDLQCHLMNLYAIKMIKYFMWNKKKRTVQRHARLYYSALCSY
ncbi:hypothetical protein DZA29_17630 [Citrobacter gillenii]|nr:hypothetical protein DZA29_17630 [Citrobacter gillenii]